MNALAETILTALIAKAVALIPEIIHAFADQTQPDPTPPDPRGADTIAAIDALAKVIAHSIADAAYHASLDRPRLGRQEDLPPMPDKPSSGAPK